MITHLYHNKNKKPLLLLLLLLLILQINTYAMFAEQTSPLGLTEIEEEYIKTRGKIVAVTVDGVAPLNYINSKGDKVGITISVLEYIGEITGLDFEYKLYDTVDEVFTSDSDIVIGVSPEYAPTDMDLSRPYLEAETVLFMQKGLDPNQLEDKTYASIKGGSLPKGIKKENTIEYASREGALNAVEKGKADYGYGNEYSITFYNMQNCYKNIVTVPRGKSPLPQWTKSKWKDLFWKWQLP